LARRMRGQHRLEKNLIDPVRMLRRRPAGVRPFLRRGAFAAAWDNHAGKLNARGGGPGDHVVWVVRWKPELAQRLREAEPAEDFHRARGNLIAFHARRFVGEPAFRNGNFDATPGQVERQRQPDRPCTDDQNISTKHFTISVCSLSHKLRHYSPAPSRRSTSGICHPAASRPWSNRSPEWDSRSR